MGIYDFVKGVGKSLGFGDEADDAKKAVSVRRDLESYQLGTQKVGLAVRGETVVLKGTVPDQATYEKAIVAVGNTLGVAKVDADELVIVPPDSGLKLDQADINELIKASTPAKEPAFHKVKKGDTLWKIAEKVYGKGRGADNRVIFEANRPMLTHPDKIYPGQILRIPDIDAA